MRGGLQELENSKFAAGFLELFLSQIHHKLSRRYDYMIPPPSLLTQARFKLLGLGPSLLRGQVGMFGSYKNLIKTNFSEKGVLREKNK